MSSSPSSSFKGARSKIRSLAGFQRGRPNSEPSDPNSPASPSPTSPKARVCVLRSPRKALTEEERKFVKKLLDSAVVKRRREAIDEDIINGPLLALDLDEREVVMGELSALLNRYAEDLLVCCHGATAGGSGAIDDAQKKIKSLEKKLLESQKSYLQEVVAMRDKVRKVELEPGDCDDVGTIFFDPLCHIDDDHRNFLKDAIEEKIKNAVARRGSDSGLNRTGGKSDNSWEMKQLKQDLQAKKEQVEDLNAKVLLLTTQKKAAEEALEIEKKKQAEEGGKYAELQKIREKLAAENRQLEKDLTKKEEELVKLHGELAEKAAAHEKEAQSQRFRIDTLERELALEKGRAQDLEKKQHQIQKQADEKVAAANSELSAVQRQLEDLQKQLQKEKASAKEAAGQAAEIEKYKAEMKKLKQNLEEQQSKQSTEVEGVADDLKLALAASEAECERLRRLLKELQEKLGTLKTVAAKEDPGGRLSTMIDESGLEKVVSHGLGTCGIRGVFRRLYDDAMERIVRMTELRHRFFLEIAEAWGPPTFPTTIPCDLVAPFAEERPPVQKPVDVELHRVEISPPEAVNSDGGPASPKVPKVPRWLAVQKTPDSRLEQHAATFAPVDQGGQLSHAPFRLGMKSDGDRIEQSSLKRFQVGYPYVAESQTKGAGGGMRLFGPTNEGPRSPKPATTAYMLDNNPINPYSNPMNPRLRGDAVLGGRDVLVPRVLGGHPLGGHPLGGHPLGDNVNGFGGKMRQAPLLKIGGLAGSKAVSLPLLT